MILGNYSIVTGAHIVLDDFPKVITPTGKSRVKRIAYLAEIRNRLLWPLDPVGSHEQTVRINYTDTQFDRILFLNDIYMQPIDALHLLFSTNLDPRKNRADYIVACAADFINPVMFYDTFVVRDFEGFGMGLMFFPWFTSSGKAESRNDVLNEKDAVRVRSCWGGMAAYDAAEFQLQHELRVRFEQDMKKGHSSKHTEPLRFRYSPELFWETSECCLINADLLDRRPDRREKVFLNPYVRVAYDASSWSWLPFIRRIERVFTILQYIVSAIGYPEFNPRRTKEAGDKITIEQWTYDDENYNGERYNRTAIAVANGIKLPGKWLKKDKTLSPGEFCGQRRLFVMKTDLQEANSGHAGPNWEKVRAP
jgi:hypothetical protein